MKNALRQLLNSLDELAEGGHDEVTDTDVREQLHDAVYQTLVEPTPGYPLPESFGMYTPEGDRKVKAALATFFAHPEVAEAMKLPTPKARLDAFQDVDVRSSNDSAYDEYFGYNDS